MRPKLLRTAMGSGMAIGTAWLLYEGTENPIMKYVSSIGMFIGMTWWVWAHGDVK